MWFQLIDFLFLVNLKNTDEGFSSNKSSPNSAASCRKFQIDSENDVWESSIKNFRSTDYIDWDMRDRYSFRNVQLLCQLSCLTSLSEFRKESLYIQAVDENPNQKCLLIDSSPHVFDQFYYHYLNTVNTITDDISSDVDRLLISEQQFIVDVLNLLLSLPSKSFALAYVSRLDIGQ